MFPNVSKNPVRKASMAVALTLGAAATIAAVFTGSEAVSAKTSDKAEASRATVQLASLVMAARPLTIHRASAKPARNVRVIKLFNIPDEQKTFGQR